MQSSAQSSAAISRARASTRPFAGSCG
jgi:hypothetical protein